MLTTRRASYVGIAAVAALTLTLGACGGSSEPKATPGSTVPVKASDALLASVRTTAATKSAHVSLSVTTSGSPAFGFSFKAEGDEDFTTGDSQIRMDFGGAMSAFLSGGLEVRSVDKVVYVKLPDSIAGMLGANSQGKWISVDASKLGSGMSSPLSGVGESDPTKILAYLEKVSDDVKTVGPDTVNGVETTHYHATIDLGKSIDQARVPQALRDKVKHLWQQGGGAAPTVPVDVWVDGDGHVVRMKMDLDLAAFIGKALGASGVSGVSGLGGALPTVSLTLDLSNFGEPVHVEAPPADQVVQAPDLGSIKGFGENGGGFFKGGTSTGILGTKVS